MKLTGKRILVEQFETKAETAGGLALPDSMKEKLPVGPVRKVSPAVAMHEKELREGSIVQVDIMAAVAVNIAGKDYLMVEPEDIIAILEEGEY